MKEQLVTKKILKWYDLNKRFLPWRKNVSSQKIQYYTLVSEFMLQQTQVSTVIPYFKRFIKDIPNFKVLAKVQNKKLMKLWEGWDEQEGWADEESDRGRRGLGGTVGGAAVLPPVGPPEPPLWLEREPPAVGGSEGTL